MIKIKKYNENGLTTVFIVFSEMMLLNNYAIFIFLYNYPFSLKDI